MPRPQRKKIRFTSESLNEQLQECYNESFKLNSAIRILTSTAQNLKPSEQVVMLGLELLNAELVNQSNRLKLIEHIFAANKKTIINMEKYNQNILTYQEKMEGLTKCFRDIMNTSSDKKDLLKVHIAKGTAISSIISTSQREEILEQRRENAVRTIEVKEERVLKLAPGRKFKKKKVVEQEPLTGQD